MRINKFLHALFTVVAMATILGVSDVHADEINNQDENVVNEEETSRWEALQPVRKITSDGLILDYDLSNLSVTQWWMEGRVKLTVTIPENYNKDSIVIAPEVFEEIIKEVELNDNNNIQFSNAFQAGDSVGVDITINNLSKYTYYYDETSFEIFPKENIVYSQVTENEEDHSSTLFNGLNTNEHHHFSRTYNTALMALIPGSNNYRLTDEALDTALKNAGYNGLDDYDEYLLNFYNNKYGTNYTRLDSFPDGVIREILGQNDPFTTNNSAFSVLNVSRLTYNNILAAVQQKGYSTIEEYVVDYYNQKYGTSATKLVDLSAEALDEFFRSQGIESMNGNYIIETNSVVNALAYDFLYNKGIAFGFEDDNITNDNSENYSIGEYMRDTSKGDDSIKKGAATLLPNGTYFINKAKLKSSGNYILNSYINYEFMVDFQFSYSALKGTVIAKYVDVDGNILAEDIITKDMVGNDYETHAKTFDGYSLYTINGNEIGQYINGEIVVVYVYNKKSTPEEPNEEPKIVPMSVIYDNTPTTGDSNPITTWIIMLMTSLLGILLTCKNVISAKLKKNIL